jgi:polyhydroxyalkanoate synthesis regulator phasin
MKNFAGTLAALALSLLLVAPASAQSTASIELTRAEIQKSRQAIIARAMVLTEEESLAFWPAYRDYRLDVARLGDRLVRVLDELVKSGATLTDEQATRLLDESLDIQAKQVAVRQKHVKAFRKVLPPAKVARFFQLENKLDAVVNYELAQAIPLAR